MMECSICLEEIKPDDEYITLQCDHVFHTKCMFTYISKNFNNDVVFNVCPICRKHISCNVQHTLNINNIKFCEQKKYKRYLYAIFHIISIFTSISFFYHSFK